MPPGSRGAVEPAGAGAGRAPTLGHVVVFFETESFRLSSYLVSVSSGKPLRGASRWAGTLNAAVVAVVDPPNMIKASHQSRAGSLKRNDSKRRYSR